MKQIDDILEHSELYNPKVRQYIKTCGSFAIKTIEELAKQYPGPVATFPRLFENHKIHLVPNSKHQAIYKGLISDERARLEKDPLEQMYIIAGAVCDEKCGKCKGKEKCAIKDAFKEWNVPVADENDPICKWRGVTEDE